MFSRSGGSRVDCAVGGSGERQVLPPVPRRAVVCCGPRGLAAVCGLGTGSVTALPSAGSGSSARAHVQTDAIALENVWNSPLVGRGAPPVPRGLSFAVVRSAAVRAVPCLFGFTPPTHAHPHPGPTVPDPPPPLRSVRPHGVPPCLALLPSLCTRCRPRRVLCVASLAMPAVAVDGLAPAPCSILVSLRP